MRGLLLAIALTGAAANNCKPFYYCCVDSENRPVNPPPDFVVPNKMEAWFAITDKFGCDPCEKAKLNTPKGNKQCLYYKDKRKASNPDKDPVSKWEKDVTEQECADLAAADEKVETYWCEEGGGPPKGEVCPPKKTYSYNFETMQPTNSPTPQG